MLHPDFPVVEDEYKLTETWAVTLPGKFNRRFEDGDLIIWRPGLTIYVVIWNNDENESIADRMAAIKEEMSPDAFAIEEKNDGDILRFGYRLNEDRGEEIVHAWYGFAFAPDGHVQAAIYFDEESDVEVARQIWLSFSQAA